MRFSPGSISAGWVVWLRGFVATASLCVCEIGITADAPPPKVRPARTLTGRDLQSARARRDEADKLWGEIQKDLVQLRLHKAGDLALERSDGKPVRPEVRVQRQRIEQVHALFQSVIDEFPRSDIASYCASRVSGIYQRLGESDEAARFLEEMAAQFAGTSEGDHLNFDVGLIHAQARQDFARARAVFARIPQPTPGDPDFDRRAKLYLAAQEQSAKCELKLGEIQQADERIRKAKSALPQFEAELDQFHQFESDSANPRTANLAATRSPLRSYWIGSQFIVLFLVLSIVAAARWSRRKEKQ